MFTFLQVICNCNVKVIYITFRTDILHKTPVFLVKRVLCIHVHAGESTCQNVMEHCSVKYVVIPYCTSSF